MKVSTFTVALMSAAITLATPAQAQGKRYLTQTLAESPLFDKERVRVGKLGDMTVDEYFELTCTTTSFAVTDTIMKQIPDANSVQWFLRGAKRNLMHFMVYPDGGDQMIDNLYRTLVGRYQVKGAQYRYEVVDRAKRNFEKAVMSDSVKTCRSKLDSYYGKS